MSSGQMHALDVDLIIQKRMGEKRYTKSIGAKLIITSNKWIKP